jgi:hypothetical protein
MAAVSAFFLVCAIIWFAMLGREWLQLRRSRGKWTFGWRPKDGTALMFAIIFIAIVVLSLVDFQGNQRLYLSLTFYDHAQRVNWAESILRTGVPPVNPDYLYQGTADLRYYYFWLVDCAAIARIFRIPVRAAAIAGCVWAGFGLASLTGLYLKHFLRVGARLREQFLISISLFAVTGLFICVNFWNIFFFHIPPPGDSWSLGQITDWLSFFLLYPHHVISMICCMLALLLAWKPGESSKSENVVSVVLISFALASAFGLSVYVAFAFLLIMSMWAIWQLVLEHACRPILLLSAGGVGAFVLLIPYLWELTHTSSKLYGGSLFTFFVRETMPPDRLAASPLFHFLAQGHPTAARSLANMILLAPGYAIELGFFFAVFLIFLIPAWRGRSTLTPAQRTLLFMSASTIPIMSLIRSSVINVNDFGMHSALFLQFPLLLLASELVISWRYQRNEVSFPDRSASLPNHTPHWLRSIAMLAIVLGVCTTIYKAITMRFIIPFYESLIPAVTNPQGHSLSHKAYFSSIGYARLNASIPRNSIVQFNPTHPNFWWPMVDVLGVEHQIAIESDKPSCGSELGGDPSGCQAMALAIDSLYNGATAEQARTTCHQIGIQYLIANVYDPAWNDKQGWVWRLSPVVVDKEFRALDCEH